MKLIIAAHLLFAVGASAIAAEKVPTAEGDTIHKSVGLKEVVVKGRRVVHYPDKDVWIVDKRLRRGAFSTIEMIGNIPGMDYDPGERKLTCMGMERIKILMDGKEKEDGYVDNLANIRFKQVEVTMHPQGLWGGYDVLVNVITKENYSGIEGRLESQEKINPAYNETPSLASATPTATYTYKKFNIATQYDFLYRHTENLSEDIIRVYPDHTLRTYPTGDGTPEESVRYHDHVWWIDADYDINKRHSVSARYKLSCSDNRAVSDFMVNKLYPDPAANTWRRELTTSANNQTSHAGTLYYRGLAGAWKLYSDLNVNWQESDNDYRFEEEHKKGLYSRFHNTKFDATWKGDVTRTFGKTTMAVGFGTAFIRYRTNGTGSSESKQWRNTFYASVSQSFTRSLRATLNGRADGATDKSDGQNVSQWTWNAGANLSYRSPDHYKFIDIAYNCNTSYPSQANRNSVGYLTGYGVWITGNPSLRRNLSHNITANIHLWDYAISGGLTAMPDYIDYITGYRRATGQLTQAPENIGYVSTWVKLLANPSAFWLTERLRLNLLGAVTYRHTRYKQDDYGIYSSGHLWSGSARAILKYQLLEHKTISFEASYYDDGHGRSVSPQGSRVNELKRFKFYLSYLATHFFVTLCYNLPIRTGRTHVYRSEMVTPVYQSYVTRDLCRANLNMLELTFTYRFAYGIQTRKKQNQQTFEAEDNSLLR